MQNSFLLDKTTAQNFINRTLLLDTNALIDAFRLPSEFYDLAKKLAEMGCDLATTRTIVIEFLGGTKDESHLATKVQFIETTFGKELSKVYLPLEHKAPESGEMLRFSRQTSKFSADDYELYCTVCKYRKNIALVTRNHKDFTASLLNRVSYITLLGNAEVHTYSVFVVE